MSRFAPSLRWPDALRDLVLEHLPVEDVVRDVLETQSTHTFETPEPADVPLWLVRTDRALVLAASHPSGGDGWFERLDLETLEVSLQTGFFRDAILVGERSLALGRGQGKRAQVFLDSLVPKVSEPPAPRPLPRLGKMWFEAPGSRLHTWLLETLEGEEAVLGLLEATGAGDDAAHEVWYLVTDARTVRVVLRGEAVFMFEGEVLTCQSSSLGRDRFIKEGGEPGMLGPRLGGGELRRLVDLGGMRPGQRLLSAAREHGERKEWEEAAALLERAEEVRAPQEAELEEGTLTLRERVLLRRAQVSFMLGDQERTVSLLRGLTELRAADDLLELTEGLVGGGLSWWMLLALAHEEAGDHKSAARVYERMALEKEAEPVFGLQAARCHQMSGAQEKALEAYRAFLVVSLREQDFGLISFYTSRAEDLEASAVDPDLAAACLELGALLEECGELSEAAQTYLTLVRQAPFLGEGYERLYALRERLDARDRQVVAQAMRVCRLLSPARHDALVTSAEDVSGGVSLPAPYAMLEDEDHDAWIVHPSEQATVTLAQKWLGGLVASEQDTADIERHCQRVDARTHPEVEALLVHLSRLSGIATPRCYLSHGFTGVQVLGRDREPFLLLGAAHLDASHTQHLTTAQMCFALATQVEHIRAEHLVLTSSEFWTAFRGRSLDGLVTVLSLVPIGGVLGKLTEGWASGLLQRLKTSLDNALTQKVLGYVEKGLKDGAAQDGIQGAYEATLGRFLLREERGQDSDSLLKEQLADFARGAMYTADRLGLVACDRLEDAVLAILALSARTSAESGTLREYGLEELLGRRTPDGELMYAELALRFGELFKFALSPEYFTLRERVFLEETMDGRS